MTPGQWSAPETPDARTTFLSHALSLTALHGPGPWPNGGSPLPDEQSAESQFLNSTVLDGIRTHHGGAASESPPVNALIDAITAVLATPEGESLTALHDQLADYEALDVADDLVEALGTLDSPREDLRSLARWLAEHGTRRNAVALGIVMLGVAGDARDQELLSLLGALEDLTLYAVVALANTQPDRDQAIHRLACRVDGWGRIHAVERLRRTQDPDIKSWLLREGFRNRIMNEYLAHIAATAGDLHNALLEPDIDPELLDGAAEILDALVSWGGPAADIRHYPDALPVLTRFGELLAATAPNLTRIGAARRVKSLLLRELPPELAWSPADVSHLLDRYTALLAQPDWFDHVRNSLTHPADDHDFNRALASAADVGIDAYPHALARLRRPPHHGYVWQWVANHTPEPEYPDLVRLACQLLPLDEIASGPEPGGGFWSSTEEHILEILLGHVVPTVEPADALPLIRTALRAAGVRLRRIGLRALDQLYGQALPADCRSLVSEAMAIEPDDKLRAEFADVLERTKPGDEK
ncbi:hypothetical protein VMT65_38275 [Nocardia sp. CDC153]|uniref:hypothetical protein n=1 Tax=Nocardia sp. CDC153 TaxID=3112167 RepID=UPI002DBF7C18|nr:hypothetical protein [Nocardia sp. CDC153]MEC3958934.1 hypothetical protein [Nocardia sp. CDC153]